MPKFENVTALSWLTRDNSLKIVKSIPKLKNCIGSNTKTVVQTHDRACKVF